MGWSTGGSGEKFRIVVARLQTLWDEVQADEVIRGESEEEKEELLEYAKYNSDTEQSENEINSDHDESHSPI
ncbi:hypothetical protein FQR65_LT02683 [Abscondita terminalis]|nr:hypothetical protein FQR65_LT02683 [Abscondita terminalis]